MNLFKDHVVGPCVHSIPIRQPTVCLTYGRYLCPGQIWLAGTHWHPRLTITSARIGTPIIMIQWPIINVCTAETCLQGTRSGWVTLSNDTHAPPLLCVVLVADFSFDDRRNEKRDDNLLGNLMPANTEGKAGAQQYVMPNAI